MDNTNNNNSTNGIPIDNFNSPAIKPPIQQQQQQPQQQHFQQPTIQYLIIPNGGASSSYQILAAQSIQPIQPIQPIQTIQAIQQPQQLFINPIYDMPTLDIKKQQQSTEKSDFVHALYYFFLGFIIAPLWLGSFTVIRSRSRRARILGIISLVLFSAMFIVLFIFVACYVANLEHHRKGKDRWHPPETPLN